MHDLIDKSQLMDVHTQSRHAASLHVCPELQPWPWQNQTGTLPTAWEFGHVYVGVCHTERAGGIMKCAIIMTHRMCVRNHMSTCVLLSRGRSSQQGCWRPRFAKLLNVNFRMQLAWEKNPSRCLLLCSGAVCDSPAAFGTSKVPTQVHTEGCQ